MMTGKERLTRQALGQDVDRIPAIGGWIGGVRVLADLGGTTPQEYLADPLAGCIRANKALGVDGLVNPVHPTELEQIRTGHILDEQFAGVEPEALLDLANSLPDTEKDVLATFDAAAVERSFRDYFDAAERRWDGLAAVPNFWNLGGHFPLYHKFGYNAFLSACALYPEAVGKIWWARSLESRQRARILARLYRELDLVPLLFCGEDLCNNQGPMVSPAFLREHYFPTVKMILEPIVEAAVRVIHHCDGDVRPLIDDFLACGFSGLQGFQFELGIDPYDLKQKRDVQGRPLLFFTSMSVTHTLPFGTPDDVRAEVEWFHQWTDGGRGMFLFTSNVTGVEVPPENLRAGYEHVKTLKPGKSPSSPRAPWPGQLIGPR